MKTMLENTMLNDTHDIVVEALNKVRTQKDWIVAIIKQDCRRSDALPPKHVEAYSRIMATEQALEKVLEGIEG